MKEFKYILGRVEPSKPAVIRFYGSVDQYTCDCFVAEFDWLVNQKPSEIAVFINSDGGSVMHGMKVFATINSCPIETKCIIDGIAASMGSVIWSAGKRLYMRDYSILMIHNPFVGKDANPEDKDQAAVVQAFKQQLETVYTKRFGMSKEEIQAIMEGEEGVDGTFFTAEQAAAKGLLPAANIIETSEQVRAMMAAKTVIAGGVKDVAAVMASVDLEEAVKKVCPSEPIRNATTTEPEASASTQEQSITNTHITMNEKEKSFDFICSSLGFNADTAHSAVTAKIVELMNAQTKLGEAEAKLAEFQKTVADLNIQLQGKTAEVENLNKTLKEAKDALQVYKDAEAAAKKAEVVAMVEKAIADGKINAEAREQWISMAESNLQLAKSTLDSIPARENIVAAIAREPENQQTSVQQTLNEAQAKVKEVLGGEFKFRKFGE